MTRYLKFYQAINEAIDLCMAEDPSVYVMGLGVPDPKGVFGTTIGLQDKYGAGRVMDMPLSENGMTGVAVGTALVGMRPIMVHQRLDFALLAMDQIVNQAAKWHYSFAGQRSVPMVIRMVVGRGWGQGPQHSQSLQAWFAHVPGLKVVMPFSPHDAKGLLIESIRDNNPVIFIEHRWLHNTFGEVPEGYYRVPLGQARIVREGKDVTIAATSHMVLEALQTAEYLSGAGIEAEVIDVRTLRPLDKDTIIRSIKKTGRFIAADTGWGTCGFAAELLAVAAEDAFGDLKAPPRRLALLDCPTPTSPALSVHCYPEVQDMVANVLEMLGKPLDMVKIPREVLAKPKDVPDNSFTGPF